MIRVWRMLCCRAGSAPLALLLAVGGCALTPGDHSERLAAAGGAIRTVAAGRGFDHVVFTRGLSPGTTRIHVYIGGDGRAFLTPDRVSRDPTPRRPLALQLMLADAAPALYVGRPCYHVAPDPRRCPPEHWTLGRFSASVIDSMVAIIGELTAPHPDADLWLIGYSGGGVVALLSAARLPRVSRVVTLAAPLDVAAWTGAHGYTPLHLSLDPVREPSWPRTLQQVHLHGERDRNVPPELVSGFAATVEGRGGSAEFRVIPDFDHVCCWVDAWPGLLGQPSPAGFPEQESSPVP